MARAKNLEVRVGGMPAWAETLTFTPGAVHREDDAYLYEGQCHHLEITDNDSVSRRRIEITVRLAQWVFHNETEEVGVVISRELPDVLTVDDAKALGEILLKTAASVETPEHVDGPKFADFNDALTYAIGQAVAATPTGLTNQEIQDALDLEEADVRNLLAGRESWNVDQLTTIAGLLNTDPATLVRAAQDAQEVR